MLDVAYLTFVTAFRCAEKLAGDIEHRLGRAAQTVSLEAGFGSCRALGAFYWLPNGGHGHYPPCSTRCVPKNQTIRSVIAVTL